MKTAIDEVSSQNLLKAVINDEKMNLKLLLDEGVNPNFICENDNTPLHFAVILGFEEVAKALLGAGASPIACAIHGLNSFHLAVMYNHFPIAQFFLADEKISKNIINIPDGYGFTALHHAAKGGFINMAKLLIQKNADPNIKISDGYYSGKTPLDLAPQVLLDEIKEELDLLGSW
ncbi:ankyrin repeat domain-containing protein [Rickettsia endosymbiont of Halotydeus destructor]|uniref:ankyrin repeat domain-containing protein n=1 Tax=Rickettsia endosymbiont of Halotydeus destructor TaxID=2996754 RepID=UPI003BAE3E28